MKYFFIKHLTEIERTKKTEALVEAVSFLVEENKNTLRALVEESKNERQRKIIMTEWKIVETRLTESMEKTLHFGFNTTLTEIHSLLIGLLTNLQVFTLTGALLHEKLFFWKTF